MGVIICIPVLTRGACDAIALSGTINPYIEIISFYVLVYFCVKMDKMAKTKVLALVEKNNDKIFYR